MQVLTDIYSYDADAVLMRYGRLTEHFRKKNDTIDFVGDCAEKIVSGDDERQTVVFHENAIIRYDFEKTIFLCDQNHRRENK